MDNETWLKKATMASKAALQSLSDSPDTNAEKLYFLVVEIIMSGPYHLNDRKWAARPLPFYADSLGLSLSTIGRLIAEPPFVRLTTLVDGKKMTLLRLGVPADDKHLANTMSLIWRETIGRPKTSPTEYGCIFGLLQVWPKEHAVEILKLVLKNWPGFMAGVKFEMDELEAKGEGKAKYYKYPSLTVIRRFAKVAIKLWTMEKQAKGEW